MNKDIVIQAENISKVYQLGQFGTGTMIHDFNKFLAKIQGKPDPYTLISEVNDRTKTSIAGFVSALNNINFEVENGEVLGIIGRNGAGKSTLLKVLSQITSPTTGKITMKGTMSSLLEVGTGMHPEMTARENVYLNGAIMGMGRVEVKKKLDDIIDFAGVNKYIDTPIKRFSSGMKVRLGFAVAAFLEPEILIVDEVLAVGDIEFQKRAIGRMKDITKTGSRTVLFVSHNMASVKSLCNKAMVMDTGGISYKGDVSTAIDKYYGTNAENRGTEYIFDINENQNPNIILQSIRIIDAETNLIQMDKSFTIEIKGTKNIQDPLYFNLRVKNQEGTNIFVISNYQVNLANITGEFALECEIPANIFNSKQFYIDVMVINNQKKMISDYTDVLFFNVLPKTLREGDLPGIRGGDLFQIYNWKLQ